MVKLYHDDCFNVFPKLENKSIDLVLCDMPYGTTPCKWDTVIDLERMWESLNNICKQNTAICFFGSQPFSSNLIMSNIKNYGYDWIWHKNSGSGFALAKKRPMKYHEIISVFYQKQPVYNPQFERYAESVYKRYKEGQLVGGYKIKKYDSGTTNPFDVRTEHAISYERGKYPSSIQKISSEPNAAGKLHPTQKPVALMEYLIKTYSNEGDTVLDFCMGSGTTGVACINTNRNFIGVEIEKEYFDIAEKRILTAQLNHKEVTENAATP